MSQWPVNLMLQPHQVDRVSGRDFDGGRKGSNAQGRGGIFVNRGNVKRRNKKYKDKKDKKDKVK